MIKSAMYTQLFFFFAGMIGNRCGEFLFYAFLPSVLQKLADEDDGSLPTGQDLVPIIHNQSEYIQHLEAEVKFCKVRLLSQDGILSLRYIT